MNWNHVWELFKINLLYANPQAVTSLQKRQEKKKKANFSIVNAMLRQQLLILILFTVLYSYLFIGSLFSQDLIRFYDWDDFYGSTS